MTPGIVRFATRRYDAGRVSAQPSPSAVAESSRPKPATPSGRLLLRMPPGLHGELTRAAEREGTSLNGYIITRLGEAIGRPVDRDGAVASASDGATRTLTWLLVANVVAVALAGLAALVIVLVALD